MLTKYYDVMAKRDPFDGFFRTSTSEIFADLFRNAPVTAKTQTESRRVKETDTEMVASFDVPGVNPRDIQVSVLDQVITIEYVLRDKKTKVEYTIGNEYDAAAATARAEHGVLEVRFPRVARTKGKRIEIAVK